MIAYLSLILAATAQLANTQTDNCIVLFTGFGDYTDTLSYIEYYHPEKGVECDKTKLNLTNYQPHFFSSVCRAPGSNQLITRESPPVFEPRVYDLLTGEKREGSIEEVEGQIGTGVAIVDGQCLSCGGTLPGNKQNAVCHTYNGKGTAWQRAFILPEVFQRAQMTRSEEGFALIAGVDDRDQPLTRTAHFTEKGALLKISNLNKARHLHSAAMLSTGELLTCGGRGVSAPGEGVVLLADCEIFSNDEWQPVASMNQARDNFRMVNFGGKVYALGGYSGQSPYPSDDDGLRSVEVYDRDADTWTLLDKPLKHGRLEFMVAVL